MALQEAVMSLLKRLMPPSKPIPLRTCFIDASVHHRGLGRHRLRPEDAADGPVLGISRYARNPDEVSCEFAVAIADTAQGKGLGTRLMQALMDGARADGLERMEGYVLADNTAMHRLVASLGFSIERDPGDPGVVHVRVDLA